MFSVYEQDEKINKKIEDNLIQSKKELGSEFNIQSILQPKDIIRRDNDFKNTGKSRIGGSSFSSGVFLEVSTGKIWVGKLEYRAISNEDQRIDQQKTEGAACKEKIAGDIYAYYGANVPKIEISLQKLTNPIISDHYYSSISGVHIMSEFLADFKTYEKTYEESKKVFLPDQPNPEGNLPYENGVIPEVGLGHILAVASLINDVDVIGGGGSNIGFQIRKDFKSMIYAKTIKIDPGEAFNPDLSMQPLGRKMRVATAGKNIELSFDHLSLKTQKEFLMTLHEIVRTSEATFEGFFTRRGAHPFILYFERTVKNLTSLLSTRKEQLLKDYSKELKETEKEYEEWSEARKQILSIENQARIKEENFAQQQLYFYIIPDIGIETKERIPFDKFVFNEFLDFSKPDRVLLIKGDSGSGKSLSLLYAEKILLEKKRDNSNAPMPIYIDLKKFDTNTVKDSLKEVLDKVYYLDAQKLKKQSVIILMDGYDEIAGGSEDNLYACQELEKWPNLKVIISCRTQYLNHGYERYFMPTKNKKLTVEGFKDYNLLPFTKEQIDSYLQRYVQQTTRPYSLEEYRSHIKSIPNLGDLISNPFILRLLTEALPELLKHVENEFVVNRYAIYEAFMRHWFVKQEKRLIQNTGLKKNWDSLTSFEEFSKEIALSLHIHNQVEVKAEDSFWEAYFSGADTETVQARSGCPLQRTGINRYAFIHRSFLEYFTARAIAEAVQQAKENIKPKDITKEQAVVDFLRDIVELTPEIKEIYFKHIETSRKNELFSRTSANAITLLNAVKENFSGMDFKGIRIPESDLDFVVFDGTDLQSADLSHSSMKNSWLRNANFENAIMNDLEFDEINTLIGKDNVVLSKIIMSPDSQYIYTGNYAGVIRKWMIDDWEEVFNIDAHGSYIHDLCSFVYFGKNYIASSAGDDNIIRIWDVNTGEVIKELFTNKRNFINFSPNLSALILTSNTEITVWDISTWVKKQTIKLEMQHILKVAYSSKNLLAISDHDSVLMLDINSGKLIDKYKSNNPNSGIGDICFFSENSLAIGSTIYNKSDVNHACVKLFKINNNLELFGELKDTSVNDDVTSICFSTDMNDVITGHSNGEIAIWNVETCTLKETITKNYFVITNRSFVYSKAVNSIINFVFKDKNYLTVMQGSNLYVSQIDNKKFKHDENTYNGKVEFLPGEKSFFAVNSNSGLCIFDAITSHVVKKINIYSRIFTFSPDGKKLAYSIGNIIHILDIIKNEKIAELSTKREVEDLVFFPDGNRLASAHPDCNIYVWHIEQNKLLYKLEHNNVITKILITQQNFKDIVLIVDMRHELHGWIEQKNLGCIDKDIFYENNISGSKTFGALAASKNGEFIVFSTRDNGILIANSNRHSKLQWHHAPVISLSISSDKKFLASGGLDGFICIWSLETKDRLLSIKAHSSSISGLSFSNDGRKLISIGDDKEIHCWDVRVKSSVSYTSPEYFLNQINNFKIESIDKYVDQSNIELRLLWRNSRSLAAFETNISGVKLSKNNKKLLQERGAIANFSIEKYKKIMLTGYGDISVLSFKNLLSLSQHIGGMLGKNTLATGNKTEQYVLRNFLYQKAIEAAMTGDLSTIKYLQGTFGLNLVEPLTKNNSTLLMVSSEYGQIDVVYYLKGHTDAFLLDTNNNERQNAITLAAKEGNLEILRYLHNCDIALDEQDVYKRTPLSYAAENGHIEVVSFLKIHKSNCLMRDQRGLRPVDYAISKGHRLIAKYLSEQHDNLIFFEKKNSQKINLHISKIDRDKSDEYYFNHYFLIKEPYLKPRIEPYIGSFTKESDLNFDFENSLLHKQKKIESFNEPLINTKKLIAAVCSGNLLLVKLLIESGISVKCKEIDYGCTPLMLASCNGHLHIVQWLLEHGSSIDETNYYGATSLHVAAQQDQLAVLRWFLDEKKVCQFNNKNRDGFNPLMITLMSGKLESSKWLIEYAKKNINYLDESEMSQAIFLYINMKTKDQDIRFIERINFDLAIYIKLLLDNVICENLSEGDKNILNELASKKIFEKYNLPRDKTLKNYEKALRKSASSDNNNEKEIMLLIKFGTDINTQDDNPEKRRTALHWAIINGRKKNVIALINCGARTDIKDAFEKTAQDYANESLNPEIKKIIFSTDIIQKNNADLISESLKSVQNKFEVIENIEQENNAMKEEELSYNNSIITFKYKNDLTESLLKKEDNFNLSDSQDRNEKQIQSSEPNKKKGIFNCCKNCTIM